MRIEIVLDVPEFHTVASIDVITLGNEAARLVSNDLHGTRVELVHAAVGNGIVVPRDFDAEAPLVLGAVAEEENTGTTSPYFEERDDNTVTPFNVTETKRKKPKKDKTKSKDDGEQAPAPEQER